MTLEELLGSARALLDDTVEAFLWPTEELTRYANNAVREYCLRTRCLKDDSAPRCRVELQAGVDDYPVDPSFFVIAKAQVFGADWPLIRTTTARLDTYLPGWDVGRVPPGKPEYIVFDRQQNRIRIAPAPSSAGVLHLRTVRVPDEDEVMTDGDDEPVAAILAPEELKHWIAYEAFSNKDSERYDPERAAQHEAIFTERVGARPSAHAITLWSTQPIVRVRPHYF